MDKEYKLKCKEALKKYKPIERIEIKIPKKPLKNKPKYIPSGRLGKCPYCRK